MNQQIHKHDYFKKFDLGLQRLSTTRFKEDTCERQFQEFRKQKIRIGSQDLRIASTAIVHNLIVVSSNKKSKRFQAYSRTYIGRLDSRSGTLK